MSRFHYIRLFLVSFFMSLFCSWTTVWAQKIANEDSMVREISSAKLDTVKVNMLLHLAQEFIPDGTTKEFYYASQALDISEKANWDQGKMYGEKLIGDCYNSVTAYGDAITHFKRCITSARKLGNIEVEATCLSKISQAFYMMNKFEDMVTYQKALVDLREKIGEPYNECFEMNAYALRISDAGHYREAIAYWQTIIAFAKKHLTGKQKDVMLARILNTLACTYVKTHQPDSALYCLRSAAILIEPTGNYFEKAYITSTFCDVYESTNNYDSAELYGERTVKMGAIRLAKYTKLTTNQH